MTVGKYTYGADSIELKQSGADLHIGKFCSIANGVKVYLGGNHKVDWITTWPFGDKHRDIFSKFQGCHSFSKGSIFIGNDVWVGSNAVIMSGVKIGHGAVIAAHTVVTKDVPPYCVFAGNPGRIKKMRFSEEDIKFLLDLKWWDMSDEEINEISPILCSNNFDKLKEKYEKSNLN